MTSHSLPAPFSNASSAAPALLTQGAEALVYKTVFLSADTPCALKYRPPKTWRHPILDRRLTKQRLLSEARTLTKCRREGVKCPGVLGADWDAGWIALEWIEGYTIRKCLDKFLHGLEAEDIASTNKEAENKDSEEAQKRSELWDLMARVGRAVGRLHEIGVVHGDLTTSNLMLRPPQSLREGAFDAEPGAAPSNDGPEDLSGDVVLIDFGLAIQLVQDEDRAVDLYVLERAFSSTHPTAEPLFKEVLRVYGESYKGAKVVLRRLEEVRMRGRKKSMIG
ncbi:serine/threonine-protein kinase bud32 [Rhizodiscina lignyota]|uniref:EKC/KEOPS complex subunit BUD32 n=1 Tax=Rhizodiscina lignyota TaxID=1504668 RepID=A0A9P4IPB1_9PEZI|nr:serine/threonine-protein kinase bud32 [Rhizodiscina lignyota]